MLYYAGIDIGSTTIKFIVIDKDYNIVDKTYVRHKAKQWSCLKDIVGKITQKYKIESWGITGSGSREISNILKINYIQEVVALSLVIKSKFSNINSVVDIGGQDAKLILFRKGSLSDMRMNGSCAGGTGAFLDQMSSLLKIDLGNFDTIGREAKTVHQISGRCGVFAKTDIQPLINQGADKNDIVKSILYAVVSQIVAGLAQGIKIEEPLLLAGGPIKYIPYFKEIFKEKLGIESVIIPESCEYLPAFGSAIYSVDHIKSIDISNLSKIESIKSKRKTLPPFFKSIYEKERFLSRFETDLKDQDFTDDLYLGIDAGSTTTKYVLIDENGSIYRSGYTSNMGKPLESFHSIFKENIDLLPRIKSSGVTGYGEDLFKSCFSIDYSNVETIAHTKGAVFYDEDLSFILDIGGQDIKGIRVEKGVVKDIVLNEACSAGCGSFLESFAKSFGIELKDIENIAFKSSSPAALGSRCTVFMNSSVITEQKNGAEIDDIMAGLCYSVVENIFTKVIRDHSVSYLGEKVMVQGGTLKNKAVLRAIELYLGKEVLISKNPHLMGAVGIALLAKENKKERSSFKFDPQKVSYTIERGKVCKLCSNSCKLDIISFDEKRKFISGNRCERPKLELSDLKKRARIDLVKTYNRNLLNYYTSIENPPKRGKIGIPKVLDFYRSLPFWRGLFTSLGFEVVVSPSSSSKIFSKGEIFIPSDTACLPAKVVHGHIEYLLDKGVDSIFFPMMIRNIKENPTATNNFTCSVFHGYPQVIENSHSFKGVKFLRPPFHWYNEKSKVNQIIDFFKNYFNVPPKEIKKALKDGYESQKRFFDSLKVEGKKEGSSFKIVLSGRPYHYDSWISHDISKICNSYGVDIIIPESLEGLDSVDLKPSKIDLTMPNSSRVVASAFIAAKREDLEIIQLVSFGCGHDAVISDEVERIMRSVGKSALILKVDEGENSGPLKIRIKSFIESVKLKRSKRIKERKEESVESPKFTKADRKKRTILIPNLSHSFTIITEEVLSKLGYKVKSIPIADRKAIDYGKRFVHNDICYPAQINIGEIISQLKKGSENCAVALANNCDDCRAGQYSYLARKALDSAGFKKIPIVTTGKDKKGDYPGFKLGIKFQIAILYGIIFSDGLEFCYRRLRNYEKNRGEGEKIFNHYLTLIAKELTENIDKAIEIYSTAIDKFNNLELENSPNRRVIGMVGEILINHHESGNLKLESFLEDQGMECYLPPMINFFWREVAVQKHKISNRLAKNPILDRAMSGITDSIYKKAIKRIDTITRKFKYCFKPFDVYDMMRFTKDIMEPSFIVGEGWQMAGEIIGMYRNGIKDFVIVQPFGCMPNHISGRGIIKGLKKLYPDINVVSLDFDPDTSKANIENRLMMLINRDIV
ncbi:MAG: activase [Candidatus Cloacimonadota bacterium]|nr:MAG: activase [Candidatus Cloacimonadota bacterium]PIE81752.1 MAG: activase [Candidatus Delongbacteria bacterium]